MASVAQLTRLLSITQLLVSPRAAEKPFFATLDHEENGTGAEGLADPWNKGTSPADSKAIFRLDWYLRPIQTVVLWEMANSVFPSVPFD